MININKKQLLDSIKLAYASKNRYFSVLIEAYGVKEVITFSHSSFENKHNYYNVAYKDNLTLKTNDNIKVIAYVSGNEIDTTFFYTNLQGGVNVE